VRMSVLDTHRNDIEQDLREKTGKNKSADQQVTANSRAGMLMI
jgi:hypothetical protein